MLNVVMSSVVAPFKTSGKCQKVGYTYFMSSQNKLAFFKTRQTILKDIGSRNRLKGLL
jgi:hypothetical protein